MNPFTNLVLLNVPITDYKNQILFDNKQTQHDYFYSKKLFDEITDFNYIRENNTINVPFNFDEIVNCNYVMYQNENFTDKWFYAFVTNKQFISEGATKITIETDLFQTWFLDCSLKSSFVEREMTNDDTIGNNTINENLDIGEVREIAEIKLWDDDYFWIGILSAYDPETEKQFSGVTMYNKNVFGSKLFLINMNNVNEGLKNLDFFIRKTNKDGYVSSITDIFIVPDIVVSAENLQLKTARYIDDREDTEFSFYTTQETDVPYSFSTKIQKQHGFLGYTPKNNKCLIYPYNYLLVTNNNGSYNTYNYEDFSTNDIEFKVVASISVGISGRVIPINYKNETENDDESIPIAKYPVCGWSADSFINWLTQQAINIPMKIANVGTNLVLGASSNIGSENPNSELVSGSTASPYVNTANQVAGIIGEFRQASMLPNIGASSNTGDVAFASNKNPIIIREMQVKPEFIRIIDDFFSMYGYKTNRLKVPNIKGRKNWNYIKTTDCNLTGKVPLEALNSLKNMFNDGVTIWHNANTFLDYSQDNSII